MSFPLKIFYLLSIAAILLLGTLVYSNSFHGAFNFDDVNSIVDNAYIRNIHDLHHIWDFLPRRFLLYLSLALNYHFNGLDVFGYHLFNLSVHLISAVLVWWLTLLTLSTPAMKEQRIASHAGTIALGAGLVFVAHPLQTEAVTYIVQRAASMATMFYLASLCFYIRSRLLPKGFWAKTSYIAALILAIMAMFTKEISVTLPLIVLLYEFSFFRTKKGLNWGYVAPFLLALLVIPLTMVTTESLKAHQIRGIWAQKPADISSAHYLLTQFRVMVTYIRLIVLPFHQNLDYDYPISKSIFEWPAFLSFIFLLGILYLAKQLFLKHRLISFCIFWFFLTLIPESSFLPLRDVIFEHRLYLPMAGVSILIVASVYYLCARHYLRFIGILLMAITCFSIMTFQRNKVWKGEFTLWNDTLGKSPHKARPFNNRGLAYFHQGQYAQAISDYNNAIKVDPKYAEAYYNRGLSLDQVRYYPESLLDYDKAIELKPWYGDAYINRGFIYARQGKFDQALINFTRAIEINPENAEAYCNRAIVYYLLKDYDKSWNDVHKAQSLRIAFDPKFISQLKIASGRDK